ncbi:RNA polymerase II mediator complex component Med8 [Histoplasma capsulatum var. duboisii H88]|uniref:RNA polymerase II mediator complex component Med8 n=1 Tax=Ajellomyces capsulatus (strain H88) TaxID=544711 RepID=A0A8A1LDC4_AJEC8|nr:RNA polymerase II mediator complex component Med8 [Histoplasma capsulatum var. duboisii H88]
MSPNKSCPALTNTRSFVQLANINKFWLTYDIDSFPSRQTILSILRRAASKTKTNLRENKE